MLGEALIHSAQAYHNLKNIPYCVIRHLSNSMFNSLGSRFSWQVFKDRTDRTISLNYAANIMKGNEVNVIAFFVL